MHPSALLASHHTAHHWPWALVVSAAILIGLGGYALACAEAPFAHCWHCRGTGRNGTGARSRCKHCDGTGRRLRHGRRAFNHVTRTRGQATRAERQRQVAAQRRQREAANPWRDPR